MGSYPPLLSYIIVNEFLNMEYRRKSPGDALFFPGVACEVQVNGHIALVVRLEGDADYSISLLGSGRCQINGNINYVF